MPQSIEEKRGRFAKMFPARVEKVVDQFRMIENCSNKSNYDWDRDIVAKVCVHVLEAMRGSAARYGLKVEFTLNGKHLWEVAESGSIESLFEETQPEAEEQSPLF